MEKIEISVNSLEQTLLIPLYGRKIAMELYPNDFKDLEAVKTFEKILFTPPKSSKIKTKVGALMAGIRQYDLVSAGREYLKDHPKATIINLGCGLDSSFAQLNNGENLGVNIDFEDVIKVRDELLDKEENEINLPHDLNDLSWVGKIPFKEENGAYFLASGVFYYFKRTEVQTILNAIKEHFPGAEIAFDATTPKGLKGMAKTWLKPSELEHVGVYFSSKGEEDILNLIDHRGQVTIRGYLEGYRKLNPRYGRLINALFRHLDKKKLCQIVEIRF